MVEDFSPLPNAVADGVAIPVEAEERIGSTEVDVAETPTFAELAIWLTWVTMVWTYVVMVYPLGQLPYAISALTLVLKPAKPTRIAFQYILNKINEQRMAAKFARRVIPKVEGIAPKSDCDQRETGNA